MIKTIELPIFELISFIKKSMLAASESILRHTIGELFLVRQLCAETLKVTPCKKMELNRRESGMQLRSVPTIKSTHKMRA